MFQNLFHCCSKIRAEFAKKMRLRVIEISKMALDGASSEKAGVGGSIPSLATTFSTAYRHAKTRFHSDSFQNFGPQRYASRNERVGLVFGWSALVSALL